MAHINSHRIDQCSIVKNNIPYHIHNCTRALCSVVTKWYAYRLHVVSNNVLVVESLQTHFHVRNLLYLKSIWLNIMQLGWMPCLCKHTLAGFHVHLFAVRNGSTTESYLWATVQKVSLFLGWVTDLIGLSRILGGRNGERTDTIDSAEDMVCAEWTLWYLRLRLSPKVPRLLVYLSSFR